MSVSRLGCQPQARLPALLRRGSVDPHQIAAQANLADKGARRSIAAPNDVWAMDFMSDPLFDGRPFHLLTVRRLFT